MYRLTTIALVIGIAVILPQVAVAQADLGKIGDKLCGAKDHYLRIYSGIPALAVIFLGIAAFFGRINWGIAATTVVGIVAVTGSETIIQTFGSGGACWVGGLSSWQFFQDPVVAEAICELQNAMQGNIGRAVAALAVIFLGIAAFFGRINWGIAATTAAGITAIFGAEAIYSQFRPPPPMGVWNLTIQCSTI